MCHHPTLQFLPDTTNFLEIKEANDPGISDGVTTNSPLMAKEKIVATEAALITMSPFAIL